MSRLVGGSIRRRDAINHAVTKTDSRERDPDDNRAKQEVLGEAPDVERHVGKRVDPPASQPCTRLDLGQVMVGAIAGMEMFAAMYTRKRFRRNSRPRAIESKRWKPKNGVTPINRPSATADALCRRLPWGLDVMQQARKARLHT
jgi:hypothetical protein